LKPAHACIDTGQYSYRVIAGTARPALERKREFAPRGPIGIAVEWVGLAGRDLHDRR